MNFKKKITKFDQTFNLVQRPDYSEFDEIERRIFQCDKGCVLCRCLILRSGIIGSFGPYGCCGTFDELKEQGLIQKNFCHLINHPK